MIVSSVMIKAPSSPPPPWAIAPTAKSQRGQSTTKFWISVHFARMACSSPVAGRARHMAIASETG